MQIMGDKNIDDILSKNSGDFILDRNIDPCGLPWTKIVKKE